MRRSDDVAKDEGNSRNTRNMPLNSGHWRHVNQPTVKARYRQQADTYRKMAEELASELGLSVPALLVN
jgi:hypothetical protein